MLPDQQRILKRFDELVTGSERYRKWARKEMEKELNRGGVAVTIDVDKIKFED